MREYSVQLSQKDQERALAAERLRLVDFPNAVTAYAIFWSINFCTPDQDFIQLKKEELLNTSFSRKQMERFIEVTEAACEGQLQIPHDSGVDATQLLVALYNYAIDTNLSTYLELRKKQTDVLSKDSVNSCPLVIQMGNIIDQFSGKKEIDIRDWRDALKFLDLHQENASV